MTTTELLAILRFEVSDQATPYLWSDTTLYGYIDQAQKQFCRDAYGIEDARSFTLAITSGTTWYTLDPSILKLRDVLNPVTGVDIPLVPVEKMRAFGMRFDGAIGPVRALITGLERGKVRVYPVPTISAGSVRADSTAYASAATILVTAKGNVRKYECTTAGTTASAQGTLYTGAVGEVVTDGTAVFTGQALTAVSSAELHVFRLTEEVVAGDDFEVEDQHVRNLLLWVKHRCYDVQDSEVYNPKKSAEYRAAWDRYCAKALLEQSRLNHTAGCVAYGGI